MKNFKEQKQEIIERAKKAEACKAEFQKAVNAENITELIKVVKDNLKWSINTGMLNAKSLEDIFGIDFLKDNHIYTSGENNIRITEGNAFIYTLDSSSANVKTWGSSKIQAKVEGINSFIRNHNTRTISVKKDNFTIEIIN